LPRYNVEQWTVALEQAVRDILVNHPGVADPNAYPFKVERCPKHGSTCLRVVYGAILEHVSWAETEPARFAKTIVRTLLPLDRSAPRPSSQAHNQKE
jgi:hypothetical protein